MQNLRTVIFIIVSLSLLAIVANIWQVANVELVFKIFISVIAGIVIFALGLASQCKD